MKNTRLYNIRYHGIAIAIVTIYNYNKRASIKTSNLDEKLPSSSYISIQLFRIGTSYIKERERENLKKWPASIHRAYDKCLSVNDILL